MDADLSELIAEIARDRQAGASAILQRAIDVLSRAMTKPPADRLTIARALCRAQPAMASIWNAALAAVSDVGQPARFDRFVRRSRRAPDALARVARETLGGADAILPGAASSSIVTVSCSGSVLQALRAAAGTRQLHVACAEGRPALEGRIMAARLAESGAAVTLYSDAAIGEGLQGADAVLVGADAIASRWFVNKVGTRMLAASASLIGVPVFVVASRDKFCAPALEPCIDPDEGAAAEIWDAPSPGILVRNPYFERVPLELVTAVVTDGGLMPAANIEEFCSSLEADIPGELVQRLRG